MKTIVFIRDFFFANPFYFISAITSVLFFAGLIPWPLLILIPIISLNVIVFGVISTSKLLKPLRFLLRNYFASYFIRKFSKNTDEQAKLFLFPLILWMDFCGLDIFVNQGSDAFSDAAVAELDSIYLRFVKSIKEFENPHPQQISHIAPMSIKLDCW